MILETFQKKKSNYLYSANVKYLEKQLKIHGHLVDNILINVLHESIQGIANDMECMGQFPLSKTEKHKAIKNNSYFISLIHIAKAYINPVSISKISIQ